jgi:NTP pyrophosphatase (non-canonical NTP hydrolase)
MDIVIRPEVKWFSGQMEQVLQENDYKSGWENCSKLWLYWRVLGETEELRNALYPTSKADPELIIKECVDVANFAMMIADKVKKDMEERGNDN